MLSYIVAFIAFLIFFSNPIYEAIWYTSHRRTSLRAPRPPLNESLLALQHVQGDGNEAAASCPRDAYSVHIYSREPLVVYIENFLSPSERAHLLEISDPIFEPSTITHNGESTNRDASVRNSEVALLPRTPTVRCVERRALAFQGWPSELWVERLRTQRYGPGGHYGHHFDWSSNAGGWGRASSFMVWVDASEGIRGGGTEFPLLLSPPSGGGDEEKGEEEGGEVARNEWCRFVECDADGKPANSSELGGGVTFRPVPGNAVFWTNFRADGSGEGYGETWHAGLPVEEGTKVGLNIWSWGRIE